MDEKKIQKINLRGHLKVIIAFFVFMLLSIAVFFGCVQKRVEENVEFTIRKNVAHQTFHFRSVMNIQFEYLESIAAYLGEQEELLTDQNIQLICNLYEKSGLERVAIIDSEGNSHYDNGITKNVSSREYFQEAMKGNRTLSDPVESMVDDSTRIILGVPIYKDDEVIGVLGGSYNVGALSHMMFEDIYDGEGACLLVTAEGEIVSFDGNRENWKISRENNFFDSFETFEISGEITTEQVKEDFLQHREGDIKIFSDGKSYYLAYEPLDLNGWMMCYAVLGSKAMEEYGFVSKYEYVLSAVLGMGMLMSILMLLYTSNQRQKRLFEYAQTDALTGLYNKQRTEREIEAWFSNEQCQRSQAFFMLDIDYFKSINDKFGHAVGDTALREVGRILKEEFWSSDIIGRIGGDEFVILMKNLRDKETAVSHAKNFADRVRRLEIPGMENHKITCSIGIAYAPDHGSGYQTLYRCADEALYEIKRRGRDGYYVYQNPEEMNG